MAGQASSSTVWNIDLSSSPGTYSWGSGPTSTVTSVENWYLGGGADVVTGSAADEYFSLGAGNDWIDPGLGADTVIGGSGNNTVSYSTRTGGVSADITGTGDDGESGEGDTLNGIRDFIGGAGNDTLTGHSLDNNTLTGNAGDDLLTGNGGTDTLLGGDGDDTL